MNLCNLGHSFDYELEKLVRIFMPFEKIKVLHERQESTCFAVTQLAKGNESTAASAYLFLNGKESNFSTVVANASPDYEKDCERALAVQLYYCYEALTGYIPRWGILTGVRPAKLFSRLCDQLGQKAAEDYFLHELKVLPEKISLCREAVAGEGKITALSKGNSFSLYLSVPFCPTRCAYCSFVSHSVDRAKNLIPQYVELLCKELEETAEIARNCGLQLETIYIGGGTPTTLSAAELETVMRTIGENFDLSNLREYTVEAGRPDTITKERLLAISKNGATRISINPQTMNDAVLEAIGRKHTAAQTVESFRLAREIGFCNINMDLIAGLPTDTYDSFKNTLKQVLELDPESVTVHALSMKRASTISANGELPEIEAGETASRMVDYARSRLTENGIAPYYMYRQSKTVGNLENVGYAKPGAECLYNVYIMDETHTILACGASAVTKLRQPGGDYIERIFNFKYPYEYINRFQEQIKRKEGVVDFYEKYPARN